MTESRSRVRVYVACSLDGFIAGLDDDLSWLPQAPGEDAETAPGFVEFEAFLANVGALLMGRRTYDVVTGFGVWPYGERPVLVPTHRPLEATRPGVRAVAGEIDELVDAARAAADGRDVYLDGGELIRQAVDRGLVDDMIITVAPVILGRGRPLFAGTAQRHALQITGHHEGHGMVQLHARFDAASRDT